MGLSIAAILAQDGTTTGAIYALLALGLVLVFSVTRVIFIPQGEFVSYGALTLAAVQSQKFPGTCWLLMALGAACFVAETGGLVRHPERRAHVARTLVALAAKYLLFPVAVYAVTQGLFAHPLPMLAQIALTLLIVIPMGPFVYRLAFEPIAEGTTLVLLIVAVAVHFAMVGLGLVMFGAEGSRTNAFSDATFNLGSLSRSICTSTARSPARPYARPPSTGSAPGWSASARPRQDGWRSRSQRGLARCAASSLHRSPPSTTTPAS
jgi:branched-chain amino acid transport system permease protein